MYSTVELQSDVIWRLEVEWLLLLVCCRSSPSGRHTISRLSSTSISFPESYQAGCWACDGFCRSTRLVHREDMKCSSFRCLRVYHYERTLLGQSEALDAQEAGCCLLRASCDRHLSWTNRPSPNNVAAVSVRRLAGYHRVSFWQFKFLN